MALALTRTLLLACLGLALEVVFTAATDRAQAQGWRLRGFTYVWMLPIYMLVYPALCWLYPRVGSWSFGARGALYAAIILLVEWASGWLLRLTIGQAPWEKEYRGHRFAVHGLMRLDYAPAWFCAALVFERVFRLLCGLP